MREHPRQPGPRELRANARAADASALERRQQVRTLVVLAAAALVFSILRAGAARVFTVGWLHLW